MSSPDLFTTASSVLAHGISGTAAGKSVWEFVPLGIEHMLLGWDHLAFIAGVVLLAGELRRAAKLISVFVLGHSTTLIVATLAGWQVNAIAVDVVIALSLLFVGVVGVIGRPKKWLWFGLSVLAFGLVHGLGLSTRLQALGLPENGLLARVIAFNVGVEIGQLFAIAVLVGLGKLVAKLVTWPKAERVAHGGLAAAGVVAAVVLSFFTAPQPAAEAVGSCTAAPSTQGFPIGAGGGHPAKDFFEPAESSPLVDFGHVLGDGYVVVQYSSMLPTDKVTQLREFVTGPDGNKVVAGPAAGQIEQLKAFNAFDTLTCGEIDAAGLKTFVDGWFADPRSKPIE
ncbi:HupE/UreJ family protein [Lentzea sp. BCCO 10_0798]|uniref:HupE/UreJ family protein n=1 Tax=Lentzea kristufekii TaxID=3095430 RepID=A0ABU4TJL8_9PSEU|nr:HupE/UreJ family protein [Lentzea sp. BCCO 10_0798]MDX8048468.1 HupE/UreJ family protein [Lentzea sp. BCCO 10_0798]